MKSMTGYGKAVAEKDGRELTIEIKAVNHRFLDIGFKFSKMFWQFEDTARKIISERIARGHLDVFLTYSDYSQTGKSWEIDFGLAKAYVDAAKTLSDTFNVNNDLTAVSLIRTQDVLNVKNTEVDEELVGSLLKSALNGALDSLEKMRSFEGEKLKNDLKQRIENVAVITSEIEKHAPEVVVDYKNKLSARITELLEDTRIDESRLGQEVCFFADKCNIDEEITRLKSHISHFEKLLSDEKPVGRAADFLVQELNRETNTICSKSNDIELTKLGLSLKNEVEKIREQIQNIE